MELNEIIPLLLTSTLITALVTAVFSYFSNRKKDALENITKERKTWREEMRVISQNISKSQDYNQLLTAIDELKVRINAYGIASNSIFTDTHIWELIHYLETDDEKSPDNLRNQKCMFINQISCILKFDWERSKEEIKGSAQSRIVVISLVSSFLLYTLRWLYYYNIGGGRIVNFLNYCVFYLIFSAFAVLLVHTANKWKNKIQMIIYILLLITGLFAICFFYFVYLPSVIPNDFFEITVLIIPILTLIYAVESKFLSYRRNVQQFIMSTAISYGTAEINEKYSIFFTRKQYKNRLTGELITFGHQSIDNSQDTDTNSTE